MAQTVIVFQEDCILVSGGKEGKYPVLSKTERIGLSGQTEPLVQWEEALSGLLPEWKSGPVRLVLPAGQCSARVLQIPYGRGRQLSDMAARELQDSFKNETADYTILSGDKKSGLELCAGGADAAILEQLVEICKRADLVLDGITVPMEGYLRVLQQMDETWKTGAAIYLFFEEGSMTSVLCQDGRYRYSGRNRLFSEPGTLDFGTEIVRSISGILQFNASEKGEVPITRVFYAGCPEEDFAVSTEGIEALQLTARPMQLNTKVTVPGGQDALAWIPCIGAMTRNGRKEKPIDLYQVYRKQAGRQDSGPAYLKHLLLPAAVFFLCLIPSCAVTVMNLRAGRENEERRTWIESDSIQEQYNRAKALEDRLGIINSSIAAVDRTRQRLSAYPEVSGRRLQKMGDIGGSGIRFSFTGYRAADGVLTFEAGSREVIDAPVYILKLQESGLFYDVRYEGYRYENDWYTLSLSCILAGEAIEDGAETARGEGVLIPGMTEGQSLDDNVRDDGGGGA